MSVENIVGQKIKMLCNDNSITWEELSERTGLSKEQIDLIVNSSTIPTLASLIKIARALGVRLGTFLDDYEETGAVVHRKAETKESVTFSSQLSSANSHLDFVSLAANKSGMAMEPFLIDVTTEPQQEPVLSTHEGEEFIYVLEGAIKVHYGQEIHIINAGDSIYYDSIVQHLVTSANGKPARILAVVYTPL